MHECNFAWDLLLDTQSIHLVFKVSQNLLRKKPLMAAVTQLQLTSIEISVRHVLALAAVTSAQLVSFITSGESSSSHCDFPGGESGVGWINSSTLDKTQTNAASVFNLVRSCQINITFNDNRAGNVVKLKIAIGMFLDIYTYPLFFTSTFVHVHDEHLSSNRLF